MKLQEVMSKGIRTIREHQSIADATRVMKEANVGMLPVVDLSNRPLGVITDRDIALLTIGGNLSAQSMVSQGMSKSVYSLDQEEDLGSALDMMRSKKVSRVVITDKQGELVGICSLLDAAVACGNDSRIPPVAQALNSRVLTHH